MFVRQAIERPLRNGQLSSELTNDRLGLRPENPDRILKHRFRQARLRPSLHYRGLRPFTDANFRTGIGWGQVRKNNLSLRAVDGA